MRMCAHFCKGEGEGVSQTRLKSLSVSKTEEDFDWAFDVFKIQMKTGYDVSHFNSQVRNFLRSNR